MNTNFYGRYKVILSRPHGGSEHFQFNTQKEAENFIRRLENLKMEYRIKIQFPFRTLFAEEIEKLKNVVYFSSGYKK